MCGRLCGRSRRFFWHWIGADVEAEGLGRFPAAIARKPSRPWFCGWSPAKGAPDRSIETMMLPSRGPSPMSRRSFDERCRLLAASFTETGSPRTSIHEMLRGRIEIGRPATVLARGAWLPTLPMATSETPEIAGNGGYGLAGCVWPKPSRPAEKAKGQHPMKKQAAPRLGCLAVRSSQGPEIGVERGSNRPDHKAGAP